MILRDGHLGPQHYPAEQTTLRPPPKPVPFVESPSVLADRVYWVTVARPMLVKAGNLIETDEMRAEEKQIRAMLAKQRPAAVVPEPVAEDDGGEVPF